LLRKRPVIFLSLRFLFLAAVLYGFLLIPLPTDPINALATLIAKGSHALLSTLQEPSQLEGTALLSSIFSVNVARDCTGAGGICAFLAAVISTPVSHRLRLLGAISGGLCLILVNTIRVACLFAAGVHGTRLFPLLHEKIWPLVMLQLNAAIFMLWLSLAWSVSRPGSGTMIRRNLLRFLLIYMAIAILGPAFMPRIYEGVLTMAGKAFECDRPNCIRTLEFSRDPGHPLNARITIVDPALMNPDGSGPIRNVDFDALGVFWGPMAAFLALSIAYRSTERHRLPLFLGGLILLLTIGFWNFYFILWDEARHLYLPPTTRWVGETIGSLRSISGMLATACLPFALWVITALDERDISPPESRDNA